MMDTQTIIVLLIILAAILYAGSSLVRKRRSFSPKSACADDCGCSGGTKISKQAH